MTAALLLDRLERDARYYEDNGLFDVVCIRVELEDTDPPYIRDGWGHLPGPHGDLDDTYWNDRALRQDMRMRLSSMLKRGAKHAARRHTLREWWPLASLTRVLESNAGLDVVASFVKPHVIRVLGVSLEHAMVLDKQVVLDRDKATVLAEYR